MASLDESAELASYRAEIARLESELDEQKARVQSLALEHARASGILEVAADGILTIDDAGLIEYVNPAISEIFGFDPDELIGQNVKLLMPAPHEEAHDGYLEAYRRTRERKILGLGREVVARHRDGSFFPIELAVSEVFEGARRTFTGTIRDISARREAEAVMREDHDRLREIFDSAIDGIVVIDEVGKILEVNQAVERIFGYTPDELLDENVTLLMPPPFKNEHDSYLERYVETGKKRILGIGREVRGLRQNGQTFPLHLAVSEGYVDHRRVFTAFLRDLGRLRDAEERVRQSEQLAELSTISAGIAHDVGTPMTTILGYAELLQQSVVDPKNRERAGHIVDQVRRVKDLLRTLLDIARPRDATPQALPLTDVLDHSLEFFREKLKGRGIVVERDYSVVPNVVANRDRLEQVFLNLIVNAIDAMPRGGTLTVDLTQPSPEVIEIRIADTGIGIEPDVLDQIFEPFYTTKERGKGTGLGLLVSQRIIHDHGGKISAASEPGVGTQISILIPSGGQADSVEP
jgi:two-component system sensor kinase FixL